VTTSFRTLLSIFVVSALASSTGCARPFTGGPSGQWVASSPEGYRLVLAPEPSQGEAALHVRLHTMIIDGPDFTDPSFCPEFAWQLGDGSMLRMVAVCTGPPPDAPQGPVPLQRTLHVDNTYVARGTYRVRAFMQLRSRPDEVWVVSEPVVIRVR
jgi:hypothetical protein